MLKNRPIYPAMQTPDKAAPTLEIFYKQATEPWEMEAIFRLNHATFVEEIPQHNGREDERLVDKFHAENTYLIAVRGGELLGMLAYREKRPFSLEGRLERMLDYLPTGRRWCEIRILAIAAAWRHHRSLIWGLFQALIRHATTCGVDAAVISGTTRQLKLYGHLGFRPFAHLVGPPEAAYQPMFGLREQMAVRLERLWGGADKGANFLPGPVPMSAAVHTARMTEPVSHRDVSFVASFEKLRQQLCALTKSPCVQILTGSGSLANEAVAASLRKLPDSGLIWSCGEFGDRLVETANRWGLRFSVIRGESAVLPAVLPSGTSWLWTPHCETSTGALQDLAFLKTYTQKHDLKLCLDCMSSLGTVAVDLSGVWLAAASSGKGLAAGAGLALVFHAQEVVEMPSLPLSPPPPTYVDLPHYAQHQGIPFTICSRSTLALAAALEHTRWEEKFSRIVSLGSALRSQFQALGIPVVTAPLLHPGIITLNLPVEISAQRVGDALKAAGIRVSYESQHLRSKNYLQICLLGEAPPAAAMRALPGQLATLLVNPLILKSCGSGRLSEASTA